MTILNIEWLIDYFFDYNICESKIFGTKENEKYIHRNLLLEAGWCESLWWALPKNFAQIKVYTLVKECKDCLSCSKLPNMETRYIFFHPF
jgi:hypothetical protein